MLHLFGIFSCLMSYNTVHYDHWHLKFQIVAVFLHKTKFSHCMSHEGILKFQTFRLKPFTFPEKPVKIYSLVNEFRITVLWFCWLLLIVHFQLDILGVYSKQKEKSILSQVNDFFCFNHFILDYVTILTILFLI